MRVDSMDGAAQALCSGDGGGLQRRFSPSSLCLAALPARAESRFALVIGNGAYKSVPALANPPNDAKTSPRR